MTSSPILSRLTLTLGWGRKSDAVPDITFVEVEQPKAPVKAILPRTIPVSPFVELTGLQICLAHWRAWMKHDDRDLGAKGQKGIQGGPADTDDAEHEGYDTDMSAEAAEAVRARAEREIAMATDAMISSLDRHHKAAIYRANNIASVWRFPKLDYTVALPEAENELMEKLKKNVATRAFF